jgi:GT2 family glycosyltransferase
MGRGKHICFIDCDVELESDWLSECEKYLQDRPVDFLATKVLPIGEKDSIVDSYRYYFANWKSHSTFLSVRKRKMFFPVINTSACIVLRESLSEIGFFDETLKRNEDLDLSIRFFLQGFLLGATSRAQASVRFKVELSSLLRGFEYLKREMDVYKDSLFPSRAVELIYLETISSILKSSHHKRLRLAGYGLLLFLCGNLGSLIQKIRRDPKKKKLFLRYPMKRGKSTYYTSYEYEGELFLVKCGVSFLFFDEEILYSKDFNSMELLAVNPDLLIALGKIFKKEKIIDTDINSLQTSELFIAVPL